MANVFEDFGMFPAIFKTMQNNFGTRFRQALYFIKHIYRSAIIRRVGDIKRNDMENLIFQTTDIPITV